MDISTPLVAIGTCAQKCVFGAHWLVRPCCFLSAKLTRHISVPPTNVQTFAEKCLPPTNSSRHLLKLMPWVYTVHHNFYPARACAASRVKWSSLSVFLSMIERPPVTPTNYMPRVHLHLCPRPAINFAHIAGVAYAAYGHMANMTVLSARGMCSGGL